MTDIRPAAPADGAALLSIAEASSLFEPPELAAFAEDLAGWRPADGDPRLWFCAGDRAAAHAAPEPMSGGVWNLRFLATRSEARRRGLARALVGAVEAAVRERGGRLLLIDTASMAEMAPARALYEALGYAREAVIRDFYADGVDRVTFARRL